MTEDNAVEVVARAICAERNAGDCTLGCTKDTGCLERNFDETSAEMRFARAALAAARPIIEREAYEKAAQVAEGGLMLAHDGHDLTGFYGETLAAAPSPPLSAASRRRWGDSPGAPDRSR